MIDSAFILPAAVDECKDGPPGRRPLALASAERITLVAMLGLGLLGWLVVRFKTATVLEDALITYRYAGNLAAGLGFSYNSGEVVQGSTTPLGTAVAAGIVSWFGRASLPAVNAMVMAVAGVAAGGFSYAALRAAGTGRRAATLFLVLYLLHPLVLSHGIGGMETPLVLCGMAASWWAAGRGRFLLAAVCCAVLVLTRIDAVVWVGLLVLHVARSERRKAALIAGVAAATAAVWFAYAIHVFGHALPHSAVAKRVIGQDTDVATRIVHWAGLALNGWAAACASVTVLGVALFLVGIARVASDRRTALGPVATYALLFPLALLVAGAPPFLWYITPVSWAALLVAAHGLDLQTVPRIPVPRRVVSRAAGLLSAALLAIAVLRLPRTVEGLRLDQLNGNGLGGEVGRWIAARAAGSSLATEAIGYQGYFCDCHVIDLAGLVSPEVVEIRRRAHSNAEAFNVILSALRPEYVVLRSFEADENRHYHGGLLFEDEPQRRYFATHYAERQRFAAPQAAYWEDKATSPCSLASDEGRRLKGGLAAPMRLLSRAANAAVEGAGSLLGGMLARATSAGLLYFPFVSEALSLLPFSPGWKLRRAVYARILPHIGRTAVLHFGVSLEDPRTTIGENVWISVRCYLDYAEIGDSVLIGPHAVLLSGGRQHNFDRLDIPVKDQGNPPKAPLRIGHGAWIGANATVLADVGHDAIVGAGSVVTRPVPPLAIVAGNPARVLRMRSAPAGPAALDAVLEAE